MLIDAATQAIIVCGSGVFPATDEPLTVCRSTVPRRHAATPGVGQHILAVAYVFLLRPAADADEFLLVDAFRILDALMAILA